LFFWGLKKIGENKKVKKELEKFEEYQNE